MNLKTDIKPISYLKSNSAAMLEHINLTHRPIIITQNGEARGVLMDPESYQKMKKALAMLRLIAHSEAEAKQGKLTPQEKVFKDIEKEFFNE